MACFIENSFGLTCYQCDYTSTTGLVANCGDTFKSEGISTCSDSTLGTTVLACTVCIWKINWSYFVVIKIMISF